MLDGVIGEKTIIRRMLHRVAVQCRNYSGLAVTASQFLSVEFRLISQKCQGIARAVGITRWSHPVISWIGVGSEQILPSFFKRLRPRVAVLRWR